MASVEVSKTYDLRELTHPQMCLLRRALDRLDDMLDPGSHDRSEVRNLVAIIADAIE